MITLLTGDNSYELHQALQARIQAFDGEVERYDGETIDAATMAEICGGLSLFAHKKLVVISELSLNKELWENLAVWLERVSSETSLVLVEPQADKRTKTYKLLQKVAEVEIFTALTTRETPKVEKWLLAEAATRQIMLEKPAARELIARLGVDQWTLSNELDRLAGFKTITIDTVRSYTEASSSENVFALLETAINGDTKNLHTMLVTLQTTNDPYMTFGLLSSQLMTLSALVLADNQPPKTIAADIGQKEFTVSKLRPLSTKLNHLTLEAVITQLAQADVAMKLTATPWQVIEGFLFGIADTLTAAS